MYRFRWFYALPLLAILGTTILPLITGDATLYHRDILSGHVPLETAQAQLLRDGHLLPLVDPYRGGGQPLLGNPNILPLYPTKLLFLVADPLWAVNAHFWLHWLLAPFAFSWLGRVCGLSRPAAWAAATCYATSGYFLSQLNLYNLVTGAALAPAFIAAVIEAGRSHAARGVWSASQRAWAKVAGLWALLLLAGDPMTAAVVLMLALTGLLMATRRDGEDVARPAPSPDTLRSRWIPAWSIPTALALGLGTLVALPMLVEFLRILPLSFRGFWTPSLRASLAQSWDPRTALEWLVPLVFGNIDYSFWGRRFFGGNPPFFYSLYPGLLASILVLRSGRPRGALRLWCWGWVGAGIFLSLGWYNPIMRAAYALPGISSLRYPIKFWILVAIPASLLAGIGFERFLSGGTEGVRRTARWLGMATLAYGVLWLALLRLPVTVVDTLHALAPELHGHAFAMERLRWLTLVFYLLVTALVLWALARLALRRARAEEPGGESSALRSSGRLGVFALGGLMLAIHAGSQFFLLQPLIDMDGAEHYTRAPSALELVPPGSRVVEGTHSDLFGKLKLEAGYPDSRFVWLLRERALSLDPVSGIRAGRHYELNRSPEGLDSFYSISLGQALERLDDRGRVRVLAAIGVDRLLLHRPLDDEASAEASLLGTREVGKRTLRVYEPLHTAEPYQLVGTVRHASNMNQALELMVGDDFDPRSMVIVPGQASDSPTTAITREAATASVGTVELLEEGPEISVLSVDSPDGGYLSTHRSWLAIYRADVDGEPVETEVINIHKLGVPVPPGQHRVRIRTDRRPTHVTSFLAVCAMLILAGLFSNRWPETRRRTEIEGRDANGVALVGGEPS